MVGGRTARLIGWHALQPRVRLKGKRMVARLFLNEMLWSEHMEAWEDSKTRIFNANCHVDAGKLQLTTGGKSQ